MRHGILHKFWRSLPYDGQGLFTSTPGALAELRRSAAKKFWQRVPWWSRPLLIPISRLGFAVACLFNVWSYVRSQELPSRLIPQLYIDCLRSGARANEALIWRQFFLPSGPHPLPGRAAGRVLSEFGSSREHAILADKKVAAEILADAGLPTPPLAMMISPGQPVATTDSVWFRPGHLFIKPRHGSASRGTIALEVLDSGGYRLSDGQVIGPDALRDQLALVSTRESDELLVQARLFPRQELADLAATGAAPVLRVTTARNPGETPFIHSAFLSIDVPGESPRHFIRGQVRVPIDVGTGLMRSGVWFLHPGLRYDRLPWNQAQLLDRPLPGLHSSLEMVLRAMALFPGLPLINWDLILTACGPVILEGNTCGDWILTNLSTLQEEQSAREVQSVQLITLLRRWTSASDLSD